MVERVSEEQRVDGYLVQYREQCMYASLARLQVVDDGGGRLQGPGCVLVKVLTNTCRAQGFLCLGCPVKQHCVKVSRNRVWLPVKLSCVPQLV